MRRLSILAGLGAFIITLAYFLSPYYSKPRPIIKDCKDCNVIVILIDTLRADHLKTYGYEKNTSPFLESLAEKSTVFEKAFSASSWTAPATASVFTSVMPSKHGVITGFATTKNKIKKGLSIELNRLPQDLETLGEFAAKLGFTTLGVADNLNIGKEIGFNRGFDMFNKFLNQGSVSVNKQASDFIERAPKDRPYFLYLHYMDPHEPFKRNQPWYGECIESIKNLRDAKGKLEKLKCAYDSEISYLDKNIEELFSKHKLLENSVVIVLADHGEEFYEHGQQGHGVSLYTELIHVPYMIYHPAWNGKRIKENVHTMDTLPTLAALAGKPIEKRWEGINLVPVIQREIINKGRMILSERLRHETGSHGWMKRSVIIEDLHLIKTDDKAKPPKEELYDLAEDFKELNDIVSKNNQDRERLSAILSANSSLEANQAGKTVEIDADPELLKELKTLGYID